MSSSNAKSSPSSLSEINFYGGVRRACDACRKKKIRCDAQQPCGVCRRTAVTCLYTYVPKKKGPKGARSKPLKTDPETSASRSRDYIAAPLPQELLHPGPPPSALPQAVGIVDQHLFQHYQPSPTSSASLNHVLSPSIDGFSAFDFGNPSLHAFQQEPQSRASPVSFISTQSTPCSQTSASLDPTAFISPDVSSEINVRLKSFEAQIPGHVLLPFVELFFQQMFPIMPVLDRELYLNTDLLNRQEPLESGQYCLLAALSAVIIVQLNLPPDIVQQTSPGLSAELLVEECFRERRQYDYIEKPQTSTVLSSFFLFCYYGHLEKHNKALYFLHESISFAECINLDDESSLAQCPFHEGQWRRRIFWLLFVTERAYALQRQNRVKIQNISIALPAIFESEEPRLLYGFVNLVNLFLAIDGTFLAAWKGSCHPVPGQPGVDSLTCSKQWLVDVQKKLDASANAMNMIAESSETQQLDIKISRQWLHILAWQISVKHGLLSLGGDEEPFNLKYPIRLARDLVKTTSTASQTSLDSHGIGMEQKIADIAGCLTDVLKCAEGDLSEPFRQGREYLMALLQQLSKMRGVQSRYLQPLLQKSDTLINQLFSPMSVVLSRDNYEAGTFHQSGMIEEEYDYDL